MTSFIAWQAHRGRTLRWIVAANLVSTSLHYGHNFAMADDYPPVDPFFPTATAYRVGILVFWPTLTLGALLAVRWWDQGRRRAPQVLIAAYSLLGLTSPGHFLGGVPDVDPPFFATMFTDFAAGAAALAWVVWTVRRPPERPALA